MVSIGFDIYGTLIDPYSVGSLLDELVGKKSNDFKILWRDKQLEYSFRQAAMQRFSHFSDCTRMALTYCNKYFNTNLSEENFIALLDQYRKLPAYDEVEETFQKLKTKGVELIAFSNGDKLDLEALLNNAGLMDYFHQIISVDEVRVFKPSPVVYNLLVDKSKAEKENVWLVSANSFDVIGACVVGVNTIWLDREGNKVFDPFGFEPDHIINNLLKLDKLF